MKGANFTIKNSHFPHETSHFSKWHRALRWSFGARPPSVCEPIGPCWLQAAGAPTWGGELKLSDSQECTYMLHVFVVYIYYMYVCIYIYYMYIYIICIYYIYYMYVYIYILYVYIYILYVLYIYIYIYIICILYI